MNNAAEHIRNVAGTWEGVTLHPHRFGGTEFRLGRRELGHLHGNSLLDLPFPMKTRNELIAQGRAERHHVLPDSGWVSLRISREDDIEAAVGLLRLSYQIAAEAAQRRNATMTTHTEEQGQR